MLLTYSRTFLRISEMIKWSPFKVLLFVAWVIEFQTYINYIFLVCKQMIHSKVLNFASSLLVFSSNFTLILNNKIRFNSFYWWGKIFTPSLYLDFNHVTLIVFPVSLFFFFFNQIFFFQKIQKERERVFNFCLELKSFSY